MSAQKKYIPYVVIGVFLVIFMYYAWASAVDYSQDQSTMMQSYGFATYWLSANLNKDDIAILPSADVFWAIDPNLVNRTESYKTVWNSSNIILRANTTESEILKVREDLRNTIHNDKRIKYLVFDWNDPRAVNLFEDKRCESLDIVLKEVKRFSFITPINQWKNRIIICEVQNKTK
ncbi:MAG: hypothetical protein AUH25_04240 [Thaumarchaeota archaeon 13_1_40CM_38_12]|nr:MAG: hypothetical protein AUH25_04240 [Thaumarchaeota archaeon 13_1_40CM_38_12]OLC36035.1 MAG: hypothetical protein AUH84_02175 [Thaumarchaeota archaeon 13_1_40CM_4_38_7]OLC92249.1 MAG: hypothetical protein AUI92_05560 [Thaumarchaeota archaeon 13_1_40CM_3_38_6]